MTNITIPLKQIQIETTGFHLLIPARINNYEVFLILDTGASQSIFDTNSIAFADIKLHDPEVSHDSSGINAPLTDIKNGCIHKIELGTFGITNLEALFMPLKHIKNLYQKYTNNEIAGIVGGDLLQKYGAIINYTSSELVLLTKRPD
jgi:hypothetical protein